MRARGVLLLLRAAAWRALRPAAPTPQAAASLILALSIHTLRRPAVGTAQMLGALASACSRRRSRVGARQLLSRAGAGREGKGGVAAIFAAAGGSDSSSDDDAPMRHAGPSAS